jgi:predicted nucleotidyltransferase component of viral defense system
MDLDVTIKAYPVSDKTIQKIIEEIITIPVDDSISFKFMGIEEIRERDEYSRYRVALTANYEKMAVPLKLDITTGDKITPSEVEYEYKLMLEERSIYVLAYNLQTILAEKLETIISRGDLNTRPRDYYDIFILSKLWAEKIDFNILREALKATTEKRGSTEVIKQYREIIQVAKNSPAMNRQWENYKKDFDYAVGINFGEICNVVIEIMDRIQ